MATRKNIVGPQIRKLRSLKNISQQELAARCEVRGLEMSRSTLAKIESQVRCVGDTELLLIAAALEVEVQKLFPVPTAK